MALTWTRREPARRRAEIPTRLPVGDDGLEGLVTPVALGDEEAFADFYRRVAALVFGLVSKVVRNPAQAEEWAQEVFVELWRTASRFDPAWGTARA